MPNYAIPPWLSQPANPAAHYVTGLQIGVRIGAQQASQQFAQQQYLREMQKDEFDRQYKTQARQMEIDEITRKHKAIANYQDMINQGVDPMTALRQAGPDMGVTPDRIEQIDAMRQYRMEQQKATEAYRASELELGKERVGMERERLDLAKKGQELAADKERRMAADAQERIKIAQANAGQRARVAAEKQLQNDQQYLTAVANFNSAQRKLKDRIAQGKGWFGDQTETDAEIKALTKKAADAQKTVERRRNEFLDNIPPAAFVPGASEDQAGEGEEETQPGDVAGDNTMPDQPTATDDQMMISGWKVRVKKK